MKNDEYLEINNKL